MFNNKILLLMGVVFAMNADAAERSVAVSSAELNVTNAKTDVLGRHNSKVRNTPQAYVKTTKPMALAKEGSSLTDPNTVSIKKTKGTFEYWANEKGTMVKKYSLNDTEYTEAQYMNLIQNIEDNDGPRNAFKKYYIKSYERALEKNNKNFFNDVSIKKSTHKCSGNELCVEEHVNTGCSAVHTCGKNDQIYEDLTYENYATVVNNSNLYKYLLSGGKKGYNIGISFTEVNLFYGFGIDYTPLAICGNATPKNINHGAKVARTIKTIVPRATLYGLTVSCTTAVTPVAVPIDGYDKVPKIYIGNHSYGRGLDHYDISESRFIDDFVYNTRTIEIASAGNEGVKRFGHLSEVARGVNVISVGAVHNHNNLTYHQTSSWVNPHYPDYANEGIEYTKPEIANYSDLLFPKADVFNVTMATTKDGKTTTTTEKLTPFFRQTSSATPYTTASVALLLDKYPFYRWHPEVVKALLLTSSIRSITGAENHDKDNKNFKVAMGVPDGRALAQYNRSRFWNGNNKEHFKNEKIEFDETGITAGTRYRIAIAWLSSGSDVVKYEKLPQNINLVVKQEGVTLAKSESPNNPFELVDFVAKSSKPLKITIERKDNLGGRVLLGYNLLEVH